MSTRCPAHVKRTAVTAGEPSRPTAERLARSRRVDRSLQTPARAKPARAEGGALAALPREPGREDAGVAEVEAVDLEAVAARCRQEHERGAANLRRFAAGEDDAQLARRAALARLREAHGPRPVEPAAADQHGTSE